MAAGRDRKNRIDRFLGVGIKNRNDVEVVYEYHTFTNF